MEEPLKASAYLAFLPTRFIQIDPLGEPNEAAFCTAGFTFSPATPFSRLVAGYSAFISAQGAHPTVGDWGAGHGYLSEMVLLAGGNPHLLERSKKVAQESLTAEPHEDLGGRSKGRPNLLNMPSVLDQSV